MLGRRLQDPVFKTKLGKLYHGDAMKILDELKEEYEGKIDLVLTDPPYNISNTERPVIKMGSKWKKKDLVYDFGEWDHGKITPYDWIPKVYDLLTDNGILIFFYDKMEIGCVAKWLEEEWDMTVRHIGVMIKTNPVPQIFKVNWASGTEFFIIATKNKGSGHHYNWKEGHHPDYIVTSIVQGKERYPHPTQKPMNAIATMIRWWSFENDLVLDPFAGTGTTLYVAEKLKRRWIGIEINEEYINYTIDRFKKNLPIRREPIERLDKILKKYDTFK